MKEAGPVYLAHAASHDAGTRFAADVSLLGAGREVQDSSWLLPQLETSDGKDETENSTTCH